MSEIKLWKYKHYKWNFYEVIWLATHSETQEKLVIYKALYEIDWYWKNSLRVRPEKMFFETITVNWKKIHRFEFIW